MKKRLCLSLLSLILLALPWQGFPGYTLLAAFVPLLLLRDELVSLGKRVWPYILITFLLWSALSVWWVGNSILQLSGSLVGALGVDIACVAVTTFVIFWPFMAYHYVRRRASRALAYAVLIAGWVGYEFVFLHGEITFPWLILGNGFANIVEAVQWYEYTGVLGGSVWVWACNIAIYEAILSWRKHKSHGVWLRPAGWIAGPIALSLLLYVTYKENDDPILVQIVQPNFFSSEKFEAPGFQEQTRILLDLAGQAPASTDYFIAPESIIDEQFAEEGIDRDDYIDLLRDFLRQGGYAAEFVIGATTSRVYTSDATPTAKPARSGVWYDVYNAALHVGTEQPVGIYHKSRLVAGPEMVPYADRWPWLRKLALDFGGSGMFGTDAERNVFTSPGGRRVGTPICWEAVFGEYTTDFTRAGAEALFVISNDSWWGETAGYRQLFAFSRLRAIENRRPIARSANTGRSGLIDQRGRVLASTGWDERVSLAGVIDGNERLTFYVRFGDWVGRSCCLIFGLSVLYYIAWRRKKKNHLR